MPFFSLFFVVALVCKLTFFKMHSTERRPVIGLENILFESVCMHACVCACMRAYFTPGVLQAEAVKGLKWPVHFEILMPFWFLFCVSVLHVASTPVHTITHVYKCSVTNHT